MKLGSRKQVIAELLKLPDQTGPFFALRSVLT
jgi:hypothetical protein